jgi:hypothetical protein
MAATKQYDVCLSFAGEDRLFVNRIADVLVKRGVRVFYDDYERASLWGKDLFAHLDAIYRHAARFCIVFVSKAYARKAWTNHERQSAQARAIRQHGEYILPVRMDTTKIPGLRDTIGYVEAKHLTPEQLCDLIIEKLGPRERVDFFPPEPDRLFMDLGVKQKHHRSLVISIAHSFYYSLRRLSRQERRLICSIFLNGCPAELPDNVHISMDLLRRINKISPARILQIMRGVGSVGFRSDTRAGHEPGDTDQLLVLEWHAASVNHPGNYTRIAESVVRLAVDEYCDVHAAQVLNNLDFGNLSTSTALADLH